MKKYIIDTIVIILIASIVTGSLHFFSIKISLEFDKKMYLYVDAILATAMFIFGSIAIYINGFDDKKDVHK